MFRSKRLAMIMLGAAAIAAAARSAGGGQYSPALFQEMRWRLIGPFRGGRTVAVSGVPSQPNVFYMAAVDGGVWKSNDYGRTWRPIFDGQPTGSVGALAVAPSNANVIYVGSGEGLQRPDLSTGDGVYKSTDAGRTWRHLGLGDAQQIGAILVDPHDSNRVFVAVLGHPYGPNEQRGVFRSTDGGETWQKVLYKDQNTGAIDLAFDPADSQTVYAALWVARHAPWSSGDSINGPGSGLYKSTDGGNTWRQLRDGLPTQNLRRIGIGIAPNNPRRMYAWVTADPTHGGIYRSDDAGETWRLVNSERRIWGRGDDFACVRVDPNDENTLYVANTSTYRSTDAGRALTAIKGAPGGDDYHTIWINPNNPKIILLGSDQGATLTVNGGETWSSWYNQPTAQFYHVITDNRFPYWVYGGQQESGSIGIASRANDGEITFREWHPVGVEEYGYVAPDPLHPNLIYGGKATRFDWNTGEVQDVSPVVLRTGQYPFNRTAPLVFSPADPHVLYLGSNVVFETRNGGQSWRAISPDLTREDPGVPKNLGIFAPAKAPRRGVIYTVAPSPKDAGLIWIGTDDGLIQVTRDGGRHWANVTPPALTPWSKVSMIDASHFDRETAYAAVNRFRLDDLRPYIYRTHDGGKSWQLIAEGLPNGASVNTVREDPQRKGLLFAGTETSVWVSFDDGDQWQSLQLNLPHTSMRDLVIHGDDLVVGTHGRSFWILDDITALREISGRVAAAEAYLFRPQIAYRVRRDENTDTPLPPETPAGNNPPDGAIIDYYLRSRSRDPVILEILNSAGKLVRRYASTDKAQPIDPHLNVPTYWVRAPRTLSTQTGMHRFVWDLRYPAPDSAFHQYPISAVPHDTPGGPRGPLVVPGEYQVRLKIGTDEYTRPLTVRMDPRIRVAPAVLDQQLAIATELANWMDRCYAALHDLRMLRRQLKDLEGSVAPGTSATKAIAGLDAKAARIEGAGGLFGFAAGGGSGETLTRVNAELGQLYGAVEGVDASPTTQQRAAAQSLQQSLFAVLARWRDLRDHDVPSLNEQLRRAHLPSVILARRGSAG